MPAQPLPTPAVPHPAPRFGLTRVELHGFRSARQAAFKPGSLCALVGEANAGKSNLLAAIRALLDPQAPALTSSDVTEGEQAIALRALLGSGEQITLEGTPPRVARASRGEVPPVLFLPAATRADALLAAVAPAGDRAARALELFAEALAEQVAAGTARASATVPALSLVGALERCCACGVRGLVLLIEEPELYLRPQAQRYLYRLLREFSRAGNQVLYSTHSPAFLNVGRLDELVFVERRTEQGTSVLQPEPVILDGDVRALTEFDAERSELFLARAAVLVEGATEKLALPFVFQALGHDPDRQAISIVECGGKSGIPFIGRVCNAVGVPFVAVHDRDAARGRKPIAAERALNQLILEVAGAGRTIVLEPDFEAVAGLRGRSHKPERAWRRFAELPAAQMPSALVAVVERAVELAQAQ